MNCEEKILEKINEKYEDVITIKELISKISDEIETKEFDKKRVVPALATCRDDSVDLISKELAENFQPQFSLRSLTGLPVWGKTALNAYYHHIHDESIGVIIFFPHIGISKNCDLGYLNRCGIRKTGVSCGANHAIINLWRNNTKIDIDEDPELYHVNEMVKPFMGQILSNENPIKTLVDVEYEAGIKKIKEYMKSIKENEEHNFPILLVSGIHIDTPFDIDKNSKNNLDNLFVLKGSEWI